MRNEHASIEQAVDTLLRGESEAALQDEARHGWGTALWKAVAAHGFTAVAADEEHGGAGAGIAALGCVLERAGYHAAPIPLAQANVAALGTSLLGGAAPGNRLVLAVDLRQHLANATAHGPGLPISGALRRIPWAAHCDELLVLLPSDLGHAAVARISRTECDVEPGTNIAGEPRADWTPLQPRGLRQAPATTVRRLCDLLAIGRASAIAGASCRVLDLTLSYANHRQQFGRPIYAFQSVQHELAELASAIEQLQALLHEAYSRADGSEDGHLWALAAQTCAGLAAARAVRTGHQLHGAIGITMDYELQRYTRRLMAWRDEGGSETQSARELGQLLRKATADRVWQVSTAPASG